jgi:hypothetical protein
MSVLIAKAGLVIHVVSGYERDRIYGRSSLHDLAGAEAKWI